MGWRRARRKRLEQRAPGELPAPLRWKPRMRIFGMISGAIGGVGTVVLVQQYGIAPLSRRLGLQGLIGGLLSGIVIPSAIWALVVFIHNRRLHRAAARLGRPVPRRGVPAPGPLAALLFLVLTGATFLAGMQRAGADLDGSCLAVANGRDVAGLGLDAGDALVLGSDDVLSVRLGAPIGVTQAEIGVRYAGQVFVLASGEEGEEGDDSTGDGGEVTLDFAVDDIAWLGAGLYEFYGGATLTDGSGCTGSFLFDVDTDPLDTLVGVAAAGSAVVGAIGMTAMAASGVAEGVTSVRDLGSAIDELEAAEGAGDGGGFEAAGDDGGADPPLDPDAEPAEPAEPESPEGADGSDVEGDPEVALSPTDLIDTEPPGPPTPPPPPPMEPPTAPPADPAVASTLVPVPPPPTGAAPPSPGPAADADDMFPAEPRTPDEVWQDARDKIDAQNNERAVSLDTSEYLEWLTRFEQANPGKTPQQIITALHAQKYPHDFRSNFPEPLEDIPLFQWGPETQGWEDVRDSLATFTRHSPQFLEHDGQRIDIAHMYAGPRAGLDREWLSDVAATIANTHAGDLFQVWADNWNWRWFPADQYEGNQLGIALAMFYGNGANSNVPLSEAVKGLLRPSTFVDGNRLGPPTDLGTLPD